jgi:hypothetical protein
MIISKFMTSSFYLVILICENRIRSRKKCDENLKDPVAMYYGSLHIKLVFTPDRINSSEELLGEISLGIQQQLFRRMK